MGTGSRIAQALDVLDKLPERGLAYSIMRQGPEDLWHIEIIRIKYLGLSWSGAGLRYDLPKASQYGGQGDSRTGPDWLYVSAVSNSLNSRQVPSIILDVQHSLH